MDQIDGACRTPERFLAGCTVSLTAFIAFFIAWASQAGQASQTAFGQTAGAVFLTLAVVAAILSLAFGAGWFSRRKKRAEVIQKIRDRRVDPGPMMGGRGAGGGGRGAGGG